MRAPVIELVREATDELVEAFRALIPQLSTTAPAPTLDELRKVVDDPNNALFIARLDDRIVGSLTLVTFRIPTGPKSWIEDVVVDDAARGFGVGEMLNRAALDEARRRGVKAVSLTSRPSREAANRLYRRIGFELRETNYYRIDLE
jgi:ribosomal protein S18 acetylase RimI-like enzyme